MKTLEGLVWFAVALFMVHEFEEILLIKAWAIRYNDKIRSLWPKVKPFGLHLFDSAGYAASPITETASIGIGIQFFLIALLTLLSVLFDSYLIWFGFMALTPFTSLFLHSRDVILFKGYTPGILTAVLTAIPTVWILCRVYALSNFGIWETLIATVATNLVIGFLAFKFMHSSATALSMRLQAYANKK
ncbi:MAG: HXXEE domain-containing protein [Eubacteriales bacterium]|nr:HXXEE domain-containing protein [Eubacteriales bacterium]